MGRPGLGCLLDVSDRPRSLAVEALLHGGDLVAGQGQGLGDGEGADSGMQGRVGDESRQGSRVEHPEERGKAEAAWGTATEGQLLHLLRRRGSNWGP
jgi:hypothetical protein